MKKGGKLSRLGPNQQKIILLLLGGIGLSLAKTPKQYFRVVGEISKEWKNINSRMLEKAISSLYHSKLIKSKENPDGSLTMVLTDKGKQKAITFNIDNMEIKKPKKWDKKWRLVLFDIPEKQKPAREALRDALKRLGFHEYQKSVFIHPYECKKEIDFVIEYFNIRKYVRTITADTLDNDIHLRKKFGL
ncbi:MAG: CRISPR-associated endonuclease Cas2 [Patescibacteria group bacterium]